jgi:hypothetical protein
VALAFVWIASCFQMRAWLYTIDKYFREQSIKFKNDGKEKNE